MRRGKKRRTSKKLAKRGAFHKPKLTRTMCGKVGYSSELDAKIALGRIGRVNGEHNEQRAYFHRPCKAWHLTSQPLRKKVLSASPSADLVISVISTEHVAVNETHTRKDADVGIKQVTANWPETQKLYVSKFQGINWVPKPVSGNTIVLFTPPKGANLPIEMPKTVRIRRNVDMSLNDETEKLDKIIDTYRSANAMVDELTCYLEHKDGRPKICQDKRGLAAHMRSHQTIVCERCGKTINLLGIGPHKRTCTVTTRKIEPEVAQQVVFEEQKVATIAAPPPDEVAVLEPEVSTQIDNLIVEDILEPSVITVDPSIKMSMLLKEFLDSEIERRLCSLYEEHGEMSRVIVESKARITELEDALKRSEENAQTAIELAQSNEEAAKSWQSFQTLMREQMPNL